MAEPKKMTVYALTTIDNPFDPIDDYDQWFAFDHQRGYYCSEYLARIAKTSRFLTAEQNQREIERAIDEIIELNPTQVYKKVSKEVEV